MRGSVLDLIYIPIILFVFGVSIFVAATIMNNISPSLSAMSPVANNTTAAANAAINSFNWTFLIVAFALAGGSVMLGFLYPSHPIFFVVGLIILIASMITTPVISNAFGSFSSNTQIASATSQFTVVNWFMQNALPLFMTVFGVMMLIVLYTHLHSGRE